MDDSHLQAPPIPPRTQILVIGSGAGGATTAATLAARGYEVAVLEEGPYIDTSAIATNSPAAIAQLYRNGGVTPILGRQSIAYVEGRCVGGSTEVNSAFWHRVPEDCYARWRADARLAECSAAILEPYFEQLERVLSVSYLAAAHRPRSSELFRQGIERLQWQYTEVPRCQRQHDVSPFAPGNKQSMQRTFLPQAVAAGAQLIPAHKAIRLLHDHGRVHGVLVERTDGPERTRTVIQADVVFVCCGAIQTAAILRRSGITKNVGDNLCIHPMIKAAALFDEPIDAHREPLPIYQVKEFWPNVTIGGSVFTPGFLAMLLSDNWATNQHVMRAWDRMALYYAGTRGMNRGTVRVLPGVDDGVVVRYRLTAADQQNISAGLAHLGAILFAAGAKAVYPSLRSQPVLKAADQCRGFLKQPIPIAAMSLSTVHAFSSCPMGENPDLCATDSFGKVTGFRNLYLNDASIIPDSPGVNPQGTIMALALRNLDHFDAVGRGRAVRESPLWKRGLGGFVETDLSNKSPSVPLFQRGKIRESHLGVDSSPPSILITGAPGWLGSRLVEVLAQGLPGVPALATADKNLRVRCLVHPALDAEPLMEQCAGLDVVVGDVTDPAAAAALCADTSGAVLFHIAGVVHPSRLSEFERVNVEGTRVLVRAAAAAGVRRVVAVSSNSPFGFNPHPDHVFDEQTPYRPYMGYGRSKHHMELVVREAQASGAIETVIIRPPWFYGPHQPARQTTFFKMIKDGRFPILGDGSQKRSMAYVDNICQGLLLAASSDRANGEVYWIADERPYTITEIVETVREVLEEELGIVCAPRQMHVPALVGRVAQTADAMLQAVGWYDQRIHVLGEMGETIACSIEKARRELGYAPAMTLREGMRASIRWCLANGVRL